MKGILASKIKHLFLSLGVWLGIGLVSIVALGLVAGKLWTAPPAQSQVSLSLGTVPNPGDTGAPAAPTPTATASPTPFLVQPAVPVARATILPPAEGTVVTVTTSADAVGWTTSLDGRSHFNTPNIYAGSYQGQTYFGLIQFDLTSIAPGSAIDYAALELVGLDDRRVRPGGSWQLNMLDPALDQRWAEIDFETVAGAAPAASVPLDGQEDSLAANKTNLFVFNPEARAELERRLANGLVSFSLAGPAEGDDNLFSWDSGHSRHTEASRSIILWLAVSPPAAPVDELPPSARYVIVTSTPTPENIITVAAVAAEATRLADIVGTSTPVPTNWVTPVVVTPRPTPANAATVTHFEAAATAQAFLYGPATATPFNLWTATPTSESLANAGATALTPTATPVPLLVNVEGQVATPWASPTPTATPRSMPAELIGKIAFLSNRSGGPAPLGSPLVYVVDPDGGNLAVLTDPTLYEIAVAREPYSADQRFRVFVKDALRFDNQQVPALYFYDYLYQAEEQITQFGAGASWDPVWSPGREQIAFVSNDSGDDEIWVIDRDGSQARQLTENNGAYNAREIGKDTFVPEVNGHPSWSPDGSQLVFWSNRTGNRQIWVMDADGGNLHSLSTTSHDDWNPVWIKYLDPARHSSD